MAAPAAAAAARSDARQVNGPASSTTSSGPSPDGRMQLSAGMFTTADQYEQFVRLQQQLLMQMQSGAAMHQQAATSDSAAAPQVTSRVSRVTTGNVNVSVTPGMITRGLFAARNEIN